MLLWGDKINKKGVKEERKKNILDLWFRKVNILTVGCTLLSFYMCAFKKTTSRFKENNSIVLHCIRLLDK